MLVSIGLNDDRSNYDCNSDFTEPDSKIQMDQLQWIGSALGHVWSMEFKIAPQYEIELLTQSGEL